MYYEKARNAQILHKLDESYMKNLWRCAKIALDF